MTRRDRPPGGEKSNLRARTPSGPRTLSHAASASHIGPGLVPQAGQDFIGGKRGFKEDGTFGANVDHMVFDGAAFPGRHMPDRGEGVRPLVKVDPKDKEVKRYIDLLRDRARQHGLAFRTQFLKYDENRDGVVSAQELANVLESYNAKVKPEVLDRILKHLDTDGSGVIDYMEFLAGLTDATGGNYSAPTAPVPSYIRDHLAHTELGITPEPESPRPSPSPSGPPGEAARRPRTAPEAIETGAPRRPSKGGTKAHVYSGRPSNAYTPFPEQSFLEGVRLPRTPPDALGRSPSAPPAAFPSPAPTRTPPPPRPPSASAHRPSTSPATPLSVDLPLSPAPAAAPSPVPSYVPLQREKRKPLSEAARRTLRLLGNKYIQEGARLRRAFLHLDEKSEGILPVPAVREVLRGLYYMDTPEGVVAELAERFPAKDGALDYMEMFRALTRSEGSLAVTGAHGPRAQPSPGQAFNVGEGPVGNQKRQALLADPSLSPPARKLLEAMRGYVQQMAARNRMAKVFISLDGNGDGYLTGEEFAAGLGRMGIAAPPAAVHEVLTRLDEGGESGGPYINYAEFMRYMDEQTTGGYIFDAQPAGVAALQAAAQSPGPRSPSFRSPSPGLSTAPWLIHMTPASKDGDRAEKEQARAISAAILDFNVSQVAPQRVEEAGRPRAVPLRRPQLREPTPVEAVRDRLLDAKAFAAVRRAFRSPGAAEAEGGQGALTGGQLKAALRALPAPLGEEEAEAVVRACLGRGARAGLVAYDEYVNTVRGADGSTANRAVAIPATRPRLAPPVSALARASQRTPDGSLPMDAWAPAASPEGRPRTPQTPAGSAAPTQTWSVNVGPLLRPAAGSPGYVSESGRLSSTYGEQGAWAPTPGLQDRASRSAVVEARAMRRAASEQRIQAYVDGVREKEREDLVKKYMTRAAPGRTPEQIRGLLFGAGPVSASPIG